VKSAIRLFAVLVAVCAGAAAHAADKVATFPIDQVLGKADAPITIIEYASTTCGHCANLHKTYFPKLKADWIDTGKAKLIYRDFPTAPAHLSIGASMVAHCAGPDRYFPMLSLIFDNQEKWLGAQNPMDGLKKLVRLAGMTGDDVDACLKRQDLANAIQERAKDGAKTFDVEATPTLIINGTKVEGAVPDEIEKVLKAAAK
jgi:protein-disulfide isomerase